MLKTMLAFHLVGEYKVDWQSGIKAVWEARKPVTMILEIRKPAYTEFNRDLSLHIPGFYQASVPLFAHIPCVCICCTIMIAIAIIILLLLYCYDYIYILAIIFFALFDLFDHTCTKRV